VHGGLWSAAHVLGVSLDFEHKVAYGPQSKIRSSGSVQPTGEFPISLKAVLSKLKFSQFIALMFWAAITGTIVVEVGLELPWAQSSGFATLTALLFAGLALGWVLTHARENDIQVPGSLKIGVVLLAALAVPYYRFKYFGPKPGFLFAGKIVLCFTLTIFLSNAITAVIRPGYSIFR